MTLTEAQNELLIALSTSYATGLTEEQVCTFRQHQYDSKNKNSSANNDTNKLTPPLNFPDWACIILPCIKHIPSMKLFKLIEPHDAEVLRNSRWVFYDAVSLMKGDIIRLNEGDIVPADCTVLSLGMDHEVANLGGSNDKKNELELMLDVSNVTGNSIPQTITAIESDGTLPVDRTVELYCGSFVLEGAAIAVVTRIGNDTCIARWIKEEKWPPKKENGYLELNDEGREVEGEERIGLM